VPRIGPQIGATFVRTMWSRSCGKSWSSSRTVPHVMTQPDTACASRVIVAHFEISDMSTIRTTLDTSAITQLMLDLCSAPCKARRLAPPAHARGLRALTMPARRSVWLLRGVWNVCSGHGTHCRNSLRKELAQPPAVVEPRSSQQIDQIFVW
jgi:hypothetical protein